VLLLLRTSALYLPMLSEIYVCACEHIEMKVEKTNGDEIFYFFLFF
jgi:hypothetical protein